MMGFAGCVVAGLAAVVCLLSAVEVEAGCRTLTVPCCHGKNVTCRANGPRMNSAESKTCFCDEYCLHLGDCCMDYKQTCNAQDCALGDWQDWGKCSRECGWGQKERIRPILVAPLNGGKKCDTMKETGTCYGWNCKQPRHSHTHIRGYVPTLKENPYHETAKIIPAMYGTHRKSKVYDPYSDIRRNLFFHYSANNIIRRPGYCAKFEVTRARQSCNSQLSNGWSKNLRKGTVVCVECQQYAMKRKLGVRCKGDGVLLKETRWNAATIPGCHGKWVMQEEHQECTCNPSADSSFILI